MQIGVGPELSKRKNGNSFSQFVAGVDPSGSVVSRAEKEEKTAESAKDSTALCLDKRLCTQQTLPQTQHLTPFKEKRRHCRVVVDIPPLLRASCTQDAQCDAKQMESTCVNWSVHTARKQHQRVCVQTCARASSVDGT